MPADDRPYGAVESVIGFARTLRAAGVDATPDRARAMVAALAELDPGSRSDVYWTGRLTLCAGPDDLARYDRVFAAYFGDRETGLGAESEFPPTLSVAVPSAGGDESADDGPAERVTAAASRVEVLRHRDLAELSAADREALARVVARFRLAGDQRRTRRTSPAARGAVDRRRTLRRMMRHGGEPVRPMRRQRRERPRRVVLLVDVSGSMSSYADALLRFAHAASHRSRGPVTEVFTVGTRLTRVTRELAHRDVDLALAAVGAAVPDWSGGTRLGELLRDFLDHWGQRGMARGAVVVVLSDGWERGDVTLLGEQMARLRRLAHRVVWANPRAGRRGYAPVAAGMAAALPHVDAFLCGHSLAALEHLAEVVAGAAVRADAVEVLDA